MKYLLYLPIICLAVTLFSACNALPVGVRDVQGMPISEPWTRPRPVGVALDRDAKHLGAAQTEALTLLEPDLWFNWYTAPQFLADPRHLPMIFSADWAQEPEVYAAWAAQYPDRVWLLWNEPELIEQGNSTPADAVEPTRAWMQAIDRNGVTACCGTIVTEEGLAWLGGYLAAGGQVPDAWHIHVYYATTVEEWDERMAEWWAWWERNGAGKPVIISETNAFDAPDPAPHGEILAHILTLRDPRLRAVIWYSSHGAATPRQASALMDRSELTDLGHVYVGSSR